LLQGDAAKVAGLHTDVDGGGEDVATNKAHSVRFQIELNKGFPQVGSF
jgi:hypothetical protein